MAKRYFWLKLYDNFFGSKRIKILRHMAGGDTYTIIYLKMQLKAMKTDGVLTYSGILSDFAEELAVDIDEEPQNVRVTLAYLLSCGLAETDDERSYFLPYAVENVGSETSGAQRVRDCRARKALPSAPAKTNAERQRAYRAKQSCKAKPHIPLIEDYNNKKRYGGNYYLVCQRDKYRCAICESTENLCVHHIDGYDEEKPENNALNKMILLCRTCHSKVHRSGLEIPQDLLDAIGYEDSNVTKSETLMKRNGNVEKEKNKELYSEEREERSASAENEFSTGFSTRFSTESEQNIEKLRENALERLRQYREGSYG